MPTYKDQLLKADYYKEQVTKDLIKRGIFPDDKTIKDRVERIDKLTSIYRHDTIKAGEHFDTEGFIRDMEMVYQDLSVLYKLLYESTVKEYEYVRSYTDAHLKELENLAERYSIRSKLEIDTTSLGNTLLFQTSGFSVFNRDNATYVNLGTVEAREGSTLALVFDADNVRSDEAALGLQKEDGTVEYVSPFNYMQDTLRVPGAPETAAHAFYMPNDEIINTAFQVSSETLVPNRGHQYLIFAGESEVTLKNPTGERLISLDNSNTFYIREAGTVEFYLYKGTYANFNFSRQPEGKSFKGNSIESPSDYQKVVIKTEGEFAFSITTDGTVYAEMNRGSLQGDKLMNPKPSSARTFLIEEIMPGKAVTFSAYLRILTNNEEPVKINSVAIKELTALEAGTR